MCSISKRSYLAIPAAILFFYFTGIGAEERHDHPHHERTVEKITITADPLNSIDGHFAAPTTVLDQNELRQQALRSIGETLANQPGVTSSDFGASVGRPVIRGQSGGRVRVLEDGVGTLDISTISGDHGVSVESVFAEQVEILRGPATLLYGSGASGGLVNVVNGRILSQMPERITGEAYIDYDSASDGWMAAAKLNAAVMPSLAVHFDALTRDTDDLDIPGYAEIEPDLDERSGVLENSDSETDNYSGGLSWVGEKGFLGFNISRLENNYGVPGAHHHHEEEEHEEDDHDDEDEEHEEETGGTRIDIRQTRYDLKGAYQLDGGWFNQVKARFAYNDYEHDEIEGSGEVGTEFSNEELEARIEAVHVPLGVFDGAIGMQVRDKDFAAVGEEAFVPPSEVTNVAVFLFEKADFGLVHVDLGLRYENQDAESTPLNLSAEHNLLSISGGATYEYHERYELGFNASRSQRAPTIEELFAGGPHLATNTFEIGNDNLGEETSYNLDVFWRKTSGRLMFDVTFFVNEISDYVFLRNNDFNNDGLADRVEADFLESGEIHDEDEALLLVSQVQDDATFWGFEMIASFALFNDHRGRLNATLWSDYVSGELDKGGNVPRLPPLRFGFNLDWTRGPFSSRFSLTHTTEQDELAELETKTASYTLVNLQADYRFNLRGQREFSVFARGSNLANETARRHTSFVKDLAPLPGRSGTIGLRLAF